MRLLTFILCVILLIAVVYLFIHFAFGQQFQNPGDQFNNPNQNFGNDQFGNNQQFQGNQQYGQDQFGQNQGFNQGFNQQYQQSPYQQYGTPTYGPQQYGQQYGYPQNPYQVGGFGIQELITALVAGGGSAAYARRRTNGLEKDNQVLYSEVLKGKQVDAELSRYMSQLNAEKASQINDAPIVKLDNLQKDVQDFTDKTAKA